MNKKYYEDYARRVFAFVGWMSKADIYSLERFSETHFHGPLLMRRVGSKIACDNIIPG